MNAPTADDQASPPSLNVTPIASTIRRVEAQLDELESLANMLRALADVDAPAIPAPNFPVPETFMLSIVIPVYNERETLYSLLSQVAQLPFQRQIILVDDCSTDGTREMLRKIQGAAEVTVLYHLENQGKGAALRTGFAAAKGDIVIIQDADLEYHPQDISTLLGPLIRGEADVVYGSRFLADCQDRSKVHRFGNWLLTTSSNLFTGLRLTDMETCYKAFRTEWLQKLPLCQDRFGFEPEVTAKLARRGCRISEVPIGYRARSYEAGKKIGIKDLFSAFYCIVRYGLHD